MLPEIKGFQRKYLRGLAHALKPIVLVGQKGITDTVLKSFDDALTAHELIKIKFIEGKEKENKERITSLLEAKSASYCVGMIGHTAIFYRPHPVEEKRKIVLPEQSS